MATDLDRAYLINGDDLRIGLQQSDVAHADGLARWLLNFAGKPLDASRWPMTRGELETRLSLALEAASIMVVARDGLDLQGGCYQAGALVTSAAGKPMFPGELASRLVRAIDAQGTEDAAPAPLCADCGQRHTMEEIAPPLPVPPGAPDVRPLEDPELIAAQQILDALAPLEVTDPAAVLRVLCWARERYDL